jgi:hypothetical protein
MLVQPDNVPRRIAEPPVISGASTPIGCTISTLLAMIASSVAATLSTITYTMSPGADAGGRPSTRRVTSVAGIST